MPFKHKNIEYGLPHEQYPQEEINRCIDIWKEVLLLQSEPVAITLLFTKEDYEAYPAKGNDSVHAILCYGQAGSRKRKGD